MDMVIILLLGVAIIGIIFVLMSEYYLAKLTEELKESFRDLEETAKISHIFNEDNGSNIFPHLDYFDEINGNLEGDSKCEGDDE